MKTPVTWYVICLNRCHVLSLSRLNVKFSNRNFKLDCSVFILPNETKVITLLKGFRSTSTALSRNLPIGILPQRKNSVLIGCDSNNDVLRWFRLVLSRYKTVSCIYIHHLRQWVANKGFLWTSTNRAILLVLRITEFSKTRFNNN